MADLDGLNETIGKFKGIISALEQIKKVNENIIETQKIVRKNNDEIASCQETIQKAATSIDKASITLLENANSVTNKIGGSLDNDSSSNKRLSDAVREYSSSVDKSVDEIRQQSSNNARETRSNFSEGIENMQRKLSEMQVGLVRSVSSLEGRIRDQETKRDEWEKKLTFIKNLQLAILILVFIVGVVVLKEITI